MKYFPRDVNLIVLNYLDDEAECKKILEKCGIPIKYYTSKKYHTLEEFKNNTKYRINKLIINNVNELAEINNKTIKEIQFGHNFNQPIDGLPEVGRSFLPNSITHLTFGNNFNKSINKLPSSITHLEFGNNFNRPVNNLPNSITHLTFGNNFEQSVDNLPNLITHLTFGHWFNLLVNNLPNSITHLTFGERFNKCVDNLPKGMKLRGCETSSHLV